ncbi:hypothetical protein WNY78_14895 [Psychroserpens sp. AS72]|uniref:hypothetical protein n=1 Tax=Psychroserpens sp. AS72 TaxID=3135775 RepID=UPI003180750F
MRKLVLLPVLLLFGALCLAFTTPNTTSNNLNNESVGYLPTNCDEPIHFQINRQEPCSILEVNPDTGELSRRHGKVEGLCGNYNEKRVSISYTVTNSDGVTQGNFIIIDLEEEE